MREWRSWPWTSLGFAPASINQVALDVLRQRQFTKPMPNCRAAGLRCTHDIPGHRRRFQEGNLTMKGGRGESPECGGARQLAAFHMFLVSLCMVENSLGTGFRSAEAQRTESLRHPVLTIQLGRCCTKQLVTPAHPG